MTNELSAKDKKMVNNYLNTSKEFRNKVSLIDFILGNWGEEYKKNTSKYEKMQEELEQEFDAPFIDLDGNEVII